MLDAEQLEYMRKNNLRLQDLYDFPMSWTWWRHYSRYNEGVDPGPDEPSEGADLNELEQRVADLESTISSLSEEELQQYKIRHIWQEVQQLRQAMQLTQRQMGTLITAQAKPKRIKGTKGVAL